MPRHVGTSNMTSNMLDARQPSRKVDALRWSRLPIYSPVIGLTLSHAGAHQ